MSSVLTETNTERASVGSGEVKIPKIAYLCTRYPAVSHTFMLREVNALRGLGLDIATFSVRRANAEHMLAEADQIAAKSTYAILPPRWLKLIMTHLAVAIKAPRAYFSTLIEALGLSTHGIRGGLWQCFYFAEAVMLWRECRRRGIRHIHVHLANAAADTALIAALLGSAVEPERPWTWSFTIHGPAEFYDVNGFHLAEKVARARFVVCISDFTRSQLMTLSPPERWGHLRVIHVGIPIEQFTRSASEELSPEDATILFIGRLVPEKGQGVLLEAVALLAERGGHDFRVIIAGDGPWRDDIETHAKRLGLMAKTSFPGAVGQDDIHAMYANATIFCLPSFAEGIPGVLMEAMAMRLPVVTTRITGIAELVDDGYSGLLVSPGRADELADALERLLADPQLRQEMGLHAREKVLREFNTEISAERLYGLFAEELAR